MMEINVKQHSILPNQEVIEIIDERGLIATITPKKSEIVIVSKYIEDVEKDMDYPPKITFKVTLKKM